MKNAPADQLAGAFYVCVKVVAACSEQPTAVLKQHLRGTVPLRRIEQAAVQFEMQQVRMDFDQLLAEDAKRLRVEQVVHRQRQQFTVQRQQLEAERAIRIRGQLTDCVGRQQQR